MVDPDRVGVAGVAAGVFCGEGVDDSCFEQDEIRDIELIMIIMCAVFISPFFTPI